MRREMGILGLAILAMMTLGGGLGVSQPAETRTPESSTMETDVELETITATAEKELELADVENTTFEIKEESPVDVTNGQLEQEAGLGSPVIFTTANYPRVDGSTATIPLSEQLAADSMGISVEEARLYILHNKTHNAYINLIEGKADIIFVTAPSQIELDMAAQAGVEIEVHPVVKEGFVFLVNEKNPLRSLTQQQIRDIYSGGVTNWEDIGGATQEIIAYQRPENSGSQSGMLSLVMKGTAMAEAPIDRYIPEMGEVIESISSYSNKGNAIGYSYYYYVSFMYFRKGVRLLAIDGVDPEPDTIRDGSYPYTTSYYAVIRKDDPNNSGARELLEWIRQYGKVSIEAAGYIPLN